MSHIIGTEQDDILFGAVEDDFIEGLGGNDLLDGGGGNDVLLGGMGDDVYVLVFGGFDYIQDFAGLDELQMGPGISPDQVQRVRLNGSDDLILRVAGTGGPGDARRLVLPPDQSDRARGVRRRHGVGAGRDRIAALLRYCGGRLHAVRPTTASASKDAAATTCSSAALVTMCTYRSSAASITSRTSPAWTSCRWGRLFRPTRCSACG